VIPGKNDLYAWGSVMSLPRIMSLTEDGVLGYTKALSDEASSLTTD